MKKLLLLGATGLVGGEALKLALANDAISEVIAPTRMPLVTSAENINQIARVIAEEMAGPADARQIA